MPRQILIVEDVAPMRELLRLLVSGIPDWKVSGLVENVWDARLELTRRFPDLVLLDEILPGESSADFLAELFALKIPVVLMSGMEERAVPLPPGAFARIQKPAAEDKSSWNSIELERKRFAEVLNKAFQ